jgi:ATP-dependent RNA helicase RhlE
MNMTFDDLGLSEATLSAVKRLGYTDPTPVQAQVIPLALQGGDVVATAQTGTGKTAAFALPIVERVGRSNRGKSPLALVVSPTRELAQQIEKVCNTLARATGHRTLTVVGGMPYGPQIKRLKSGVDILIATPGRLFDLMDRRVVDLGQIEMLVLDEADRMLDMGFWPTMEQVIAATPDTRQTMLFSATIERRVMENLEGVLNEPSYVEIAHRGETADQVEQYIAPITQSRKPDLLRAVLEERGNEHIIVFARTKSRADTCARFLCDAGYQAEAIHSDKSQGQRRHALDNFKRGRTSILVATDVLARGIDVSGVEHVINYDLPDCPEDYIHRIGRTGRAGKAGDAISFVSSDTRRLLQDIEKLIGKKIPAIELESFELEKIDLSAKKGGNGNRHSSRYHQGSKSSAHRNNSSNGDAAGRGGDRSHAGRPNRKPAEGTARVAHPSGSARRDGHSTTARPSGPGAGNTAKGARKGNGSGANANHDNRPGRSRRAETPAAFGKYSSNRSR